MQCLKSVVHLHLVRSVVDEVGVEEWIQGRSAIHEIAKHHSKTTSQRFHLGVEGEAQLLSSSIHPSLQRHCDLHSDSSIPHVRRLPFRRTLSLLFASASGDHSCFEGRLSTYAIIITTHKAQISTLSFLIALLQ